MDIYAFYVVIATLLFSALFSGIEIAFVSADKLHIELQAKQGEYAGKILSNFIKKPSFFIGTMLVGNTLALVVYGYFIALLLEPGISSLLPAGLDEDVAGPLILMIQTLVSTFIVLITAEFTPKSVFLLNPNWFLTVFAIPIGIIYVIMYPVVYIIIGLSRFIITKVLGFDYSEDKPVYRLTDLNNYIQNNLVPLDKKEENNELVDTKILNNALEFKTIRVRECMIPRTEMIAVDIEDGIEELRDAFIKSGHSKILIYKESIDEIVGYCHSLELFKKPKDINTILTPIIIVPETMLANELMIQFITEHKSLALVVDEFGGTSGIVSMEDIIEEIFGDIQDEHDVEDLIEQQLDENSFKLSARHEIDYLNEKYNWNLPDGDYDTLGGLILSFNEDIPSIHEQVRIGPFLFEILAMEGNRIDTVKLTVRTNTDENS